ncbi:hypothetical protein cyc_00415 [Cyclospora cayetanensis]|uniref:Transmembrane protein n=1 Tax=Cyclospora cayetanensis TaxID=88456 RepID=A0A1D3CT85_9EIME|nr:hypothetical protein cyc_00415 [Cyclospora cayetanensis]
MSRIAAQRAVQVSLSPTEGSSPYKLEREEAAASEPPHGVLNHLIDKRRPKAWRLALSALVVTFVAFLVVKCFSLMRRSTNGFGAATRRLAEAALPKSSSDVSACVLTADEGSGVPTTEGDTDVPRGNEGSISEGLLSANHGGGGSSPPRESKDPTLIGSSVDPEGSSVDPEGSLVDPTANPTHPEEGVLFPEGAQHHLMPIGHLKQQGLSKKALLKEKVKRRQWVADAVKAEAQRLGDAVGWLEEEEIEPLGHATWDEDDVFD